jgi:RNA polymerase sigma-70 factor (ECF subfamily)
MTSQNSEPPRRDLILRCKQGDEIALGELLERHRDWLKNMAMKSLNGRVSSRVDASDVVQQTLLSACNRIQQFTGTTSGEFAAWLQRIHERNIQDALRRHLDAGKRSMNKETALPHGDHGESVAAQHESTPSQHAIRLERAEQLLQMLDALPADQAEAVRLRHLEGWSLAQLTEHFGRSTDSVASLLKRGLENLRQRTRDD